MPKEWYYKTPKYFGNTQKAALSPAQSGFLELLEVSPESKEVTINGEPAKLIIQSLKDSNDSKKVLGIIDTFKLGDLILWGDFTWLVTTFVSNNTMHSFGNMELCKSNVAIESPPSKIKIGNDPSGKPIYQTVKGDTISFPCVVSNTLKNSGGNEEGLNLPTGMIVAKFQYAESALLQPNCLCKILNQPYKIVDIDYTNTYLKNGLQTGVVSILANKVQQQES